MMRKVFGTFDALPSKVPKTFSPLIGDGA